MSQADYLLDALIEESAEIEDKTLVVDGYFRTIMIPSSIPILGVECDDEVLRLRFRVPRYLSDVDLSKFTPRINYLNARGEEDAYDVDDAKIVGNNIEFTWLVGPTATAYKGKTKFNVCMKLTNSEGIILKEFNTTPATLPVLEGLEVSEGLISQYADILEQWRTKLFGAGDTVEAEIIATSEAEKTSIRSLSETEQADIVAKGIETLSTIPNDYATTYNMADEALRRKADAVICNASGERITLDDSSNSHLLGLKVYGRTEQINTTGKNLFSVTRALANQKVDATAANNYTAYDNGVCTNKDSYNSGRTFMYLDIPAGSYTISADVNAANKWNFSVKILNESTDMVTQTKETTDTRVEYSFTISEDSTVGFCFVPASPSGIYVYTTNIQLEVGNVATTWELCTDGYATPCVEYPQELNNIVDPELQVSCKNLIPFPYTDGSTTNNGLTYVVNPDKSVTVSGTTTKGANWHFAMNYDIVLPPGTYTLSGMADFTGMAMLLYDGIKIVGSLSGGHTSSTFTVKETTKVNAYLNYPYEGSTVSGTCCPMLEVGDKVTSYEPPTDVQSLTYTNTLCGIPVTQNGNYIDDEGQQWLCDEVDFERGKYIQRVVMKTVDGSYTYQEAATQVGDTYTAFLSFTDIWIPDNERYIADTFKTYPGTTYKTSAAEGVYGNPGDRTNNRIIVRVSKERAHDLTSFTEWITDHPINVLCILKTPIERDLSVAEIQAFRELCTNATNTTILNSRDAMMDVKYVADLERWIYKNVSYKVRKFDLVLPLANWVESDDKMYLTQTPNVSVRKNARVDLFPTIEQQIALIQNGTVLFAENKDSVVTVVAIGTSPSSDMTIQATEQVVVYE